MYEETERRSADAAAATEPYRVSSSAGVDREGGIERMPETPVLKLKEELGERDRGRAVSDSEEGALRSQTWVVRIAGLLDPDIH